MPHKRLSPRAALVGRTLLLFVFLGAAVFAAVEHAPAAAAAAGAVAALNTFYVLVIWRTYRRDPPRVG
jgi:hypothetical protein